MQTTQPNTHLPSTESLSDALHTTEVALHETSVRPPPELNWQGKRLLTDLENITSSERRFLEERNSDSLIQMILEEGRLAAIDMQNELKSGHLKGIDKQTAKQMAEQAHGVLSDVQSLAMELISSQQFRTELLSLLECFSLIAQEITGVETTKITDPLKTVPDEMKLANQTGGRSEVLESAREKIQEVAQAAKEVAKDLSGGDVKMLDDQQFERLADKLRRTLEEISRRPKSKRVMNGLVELVQMFTSHYSMEHNKGQVKEIVENAGQSAHWHNLQNHVRTLVERFAGVEVVEILIQHVSAITDITRTDNEVKDYFFEVKQFIIDSLDQPENLKEGGSGEKELRKLMKKGRKIFEHRELREHFIGTINYAMKVVQSFMNDPYIAQLQSDIGMFISDLAMDDNGNLVITKGGLNQLKVILVASLIERMAIPIPMITHEDEKMEFEVSNLWLVLKDVLPDSVHLEYREAIDLDTSDLRGKGIGVSEENQVIIHAANMKYSMKDANIWWKRKRFPKTEDSGVLDMNMPGDGIELRIVLTIKLKDKDQIFRVKSVDCDIDKINLKLSGTKHNKLYNAFLRVTKGAMKKRIESAIEEKVTDMIGMLNGQISRQIVNATMQGQKKMFGGIKGQFESLTGVSLGSENLDVKEKRNERREERREEERERVRGEERWDGDQQVAYVKETVKITTPDGNTTVTTTEVPYQ